MALSPEWALEHLATKPDINRLEGSINAISEDNAHCNKQRAEHEERIKYLEKINDTEQETKWHITGYIIALAAPISALVAWIVVHLKGS